MLAFLSGLLAGGMHVLSGPDHLAAVLPLAARSPGHGRTFGAYWGLGHGGGMLLWLILGLTLRSAVPLEVISGWAEVLVGFSLVAVGLWTIRDRARGADACENMHEQHADGRSARFRVRAKPGVHEQRAALGLGMLHGTAGAGHLLVALPLLGLSLEGGILYCAGFVLAGVASMAGAGALMGRMTRRPGMGTYARPVCALIALVIGFAWIAEAISV